MKSSEVRRSFIEFFEGKEHREVPSAPVIPHGDPTLLFTNAGMNQFKDVFLATGTRPYTRAVDTQKCIRASGKHNDLEDVGRDTYHHTFFEMLGNWSFGDYYKEEAIAWAWELLVDVWGLPVERLHATVFETDDEAYEIWKKYLPESRIHRCGAKDNFWEMGATGPCGPCSEIHYDRTPDLSGGKLVNAGVQEVIEIWNLVFMQFNRMPDGELKPLDKRHVDTGMGFERICAILQNQASNYDTDIFAPLLQRLSELSGREYKHDLDDPDSTAMRVIADHIRTLSFAIADGALPGNTGRGYVLRRILRRAARYARNLGFNEPLMFKLVGVLADQMGDVFPELVQQREMIERVVRSEEESFLQTLERGLERFDEIVNNLREAGAEELVVPGADAFQLYDTFGFPLDLTELIARERGIGVDQAGFDEHMAQQKARSREARKVHHQEVDVPVLDVKTAFVGYEQESAESEVLYAEENRVVLAETPFYAESGGQVSDTGTITMGGEEYKVVDVRKSGDAIVHIVDGEVEALAGSTALARVDRARRAKIRANHSVTHLLHEALRRVLGDHIKQEGSLVHPDYLRFDFPHFEKPDAADLNAIEEMVNAKIREFIPVVTKELPIDEARNIPGVRMFFGDKYGDSVRVVTIDDSYSVEFCGGTHVANTSEIGLFKITGESSIAAGVRRLEAVSGAGVQQFIGGLERSLTKEKSTVEELQGKIREMQKEIDKHRAAELAGGVDDYIKQAKNHGDIRIVAQRVAADSMDQLKNLGDELRAALDTQGIGLLALEIDGKAQLVCVVTDDLKKQYPAGKLVGIAAKALGGGGGGKPHMATAGGKDLDKLDDVLAGFVDTVAGFGS